MPDTPDRVPCGDPEHYADEVDAAAPDDGLNPSIPHVIAAGAGDEQPSRVTYRPAPTAAIDLPRVELTPELDAQLEAARHERLFGPRMVDPGVALAGAAYARAAGACGPCALDLAARFAGRRPGDELPGLWSRQVLTTVVRQLDEQGAHCRSHGHDA